VRVRACVGMRVTRFHHYTSSTDAVRLTTMFDCLVSIEAWWTGS